MRRHRPTTTIVRGVFNLFQIELRDTLIAVLHSFGRIQMISICSLNIKKLLRLIIIAKCITGIDIAIQGEASSCQKLMFVAQNTTFLDLLLAMLDALLVGWNCSYVTRVAHNRISELICLFIFYFVLVLLDELLVSRVQC